MTRSGGYTLIDDITDEDVTDGEGNASSSDNYYAATPPPPNPRRAGRRRAAYGDGSTVQTTTSESFSSDDGVPSDAKIFRRRTTDKAPRGRGTGATRVPEINDAPLEHHELGYFPASEGYHAGGGRKRRASECTEGAHSYACSKCGNRLTLWSLVAPEIPTILCVVLTAIVVYLVFCSRRGGGGGGEGGAAPSLSSRDDSAMPRYF